MSDSERSVLDLLGTYASRDVTQLLAHVVGRSPNDLRARPDIVVSQDDSAAFLEMKQRLDAGTPLAYLLGTWEFWSLELEVTPDVLIPRPDTETLVEVALQQLRGLRTPLIADLGTGSGAIALALASERPDATVVATDQSRDALAVAQRNALRHHLTVDFRCGDWCEPLQTDRFDLIVSNPPYIRTNDPHLDLGDLPYEPLAALESGSTGLEAYQVIARDAIKHLEPDGLLALEHGYDQREALLALLGEHHYRDIHVTDDLTGTARVIAGRRPS